MKKCKCGSIRITVYRTHSICEDCGLESPAQYPIAEEKINDENSILRLGTKGTGKAPEVDS